MKYYKIGRVEIYLCMDKVDGGPLKKKWMKIGSIDKERERMH